MTFWVRNSIRIIKTGSYQVGWRGGGYNFFKF